MKHINNKGEATLIVLAVVAVVGLGVWLFKPKVLHGDSRRAQESTEVTQRLLEAEKKRSATAAASVQAIATANSTAPASRQKDFIAQEVQVAAANQEAPDARALLEAERRRVAVMEGRLEEASALYANALNRAEKLEKERAAAVAARQATDLELQQVAAERLGAERTQNIVIAVAVLFFLGWLYVKFTHLSPGAVAELAGDMKAKGIDISPLDGVTSRLQQLVVRTINKLKS